MSENVQITSGSGTTIATDEVSINATTVQVQRVKIALGADGAWDGDLDPGQTTAANSLPVAIASDQATNKVDDAAFTPGTSLVTMVGAEFDDTGPDSVDEGDAGALRMSANRNLYVRIRDNAGNERGLNVDASGFIGVTDGAGSLTVDNAGTFAVQATVAAGATNIAKAEDVASADADVGVPAMAVRKATPANTSGTDGDYEMLQMSAGRLWTSAVIDTALPAGTNAIGKLAANSGVDIGDVDVTSISAGENHLGEIGGAGTLLEVTLSLDTSAYAADDVMADTQSAASAFRVNAGRAILQSVTVIDEDDQGKTFDIIFLDTNNSLGTENAAASISDANARTILGRVRIESSEYIDLGGVKIANKNGVGMFLKAASASTTLYVGTIIREAGTYTASGVKLRLGLLWD